MGCFGGGGLTNEKAYQLGKFARVALGTSQIDYNGRFCMSSAAVAATRAFGIDRGLPFPLADIAAAEVILLVGANPADTMPPAMQWFDEGRSRGATHITIDPRRSSTGSGSKLHLQPVPGTDLALANGLLHLAIGYGHLDSAYIADRTRGFEQVRRVVRSYWPDRVERITGVPVAQLDEAARLLGDGYRCLDDPQAREHVAAVWGVEPDSLPGPGVSAYEMLDRLGTDGGLRTLLVFASNVAVSAPHTTHVAQRLAGLDFLAVSDFVLSETAELADVVLPCTQWAEEEGTLTNLEGRVLLRRRALNPPPEVRSDLQILCDLAERFGCQVRFPDQPRAVFDELRAASAGGMAGYAGITYDRIADEQGVFWPCPESYVKDVGIVAVEGGQWEIYIGGAAGATVRKGDLLATVDSRDMAITLTGRFMQYYRENAKWLERSYDFVPRIGLVELQAIVVDDRDEIASRLDEAMQRSVDAYRDPWQEHRQPVTEGQFRDALPLVELPKVPARTADVLLPAEAE